MKSSTIVRREQDMSAPFKIWIESLKRFAGRSWRRYIVDECPDEKEQRRRQRIDNIMHDVILLEAVRRQRIDAKKAANTKK
jgi:hypothetical protein